MFVYHHAKWQLERHRRRLASNDDYHSDRTSQFAVTHKTMTYKVQHENFWVTRYPSFLPSVIFGYWNYQRDKKIWYCEQKNFNVQKIVEIILIYKRFCIFINTTKKCNFVLFPLKRAFFSFLKIYRKRHELYFNAWGSFSITSILLAPTLSVLLPPLLSASLVLCWQNRRDDSR